MTAAVITIAILAVIALIIAKEYSKFKEEQREEENRKAQLKKAVDIFKEEESLLQNKLPEILEQIKPEEIVKIEEKPKRKYNLKKKTSKKNITK